MCHLLIYIRHLGTAVHAFLVFCTSQNTLTNRTNIHRTDSSTIERLKNADCCILVTEWDEFKELKPEDFTENMKQPILIDGRRIYNPEEFTRKMKFKAIGLGH